MFEVRMKGVWYISVCVLLCLVLTGCDDGLAPPATPPPSTGTVSGVVRFTNWDSAGTVLDIRLAFFRVFPPNDIVSEVLGGRAVVYPALGAGALVTTGTDSIQYSLAVPAGTFQYVAVAQQFGSNIMTDWRAVGQYDLDTNLTIPSPVVIVADDTTFGVNINVDFSHLPPPPF